MCGLTGFYTLNKKNNREFFLKNLELMTNTILHRGPDSKNIWLDINNQIGLGHTRLSIRDLSTLGNQPMISKNKRYKIVYNGEIYNSDIIKKELNEKKLTLKSNSDTEVLLESISFFGLEKTLKKINGIFSFALFDANEKKLILARDRFGVKPMYWSKFKNNFVFGSELKAISKFYNFEKELNYDGVNFYLKYGSIPSPISIFKNVNKLLPGEFLEIDKNLQITSKKYFDLHNKFSLSKSKISFNDALVQLENKIEKAVQNQLVSDLEVGSFLSGGIDSSLISFYMQKNSYKKIKTFSIGFEDKKFDESSKAKDLGNYLGTDHTTTIFNKNKVLEYFEIISDVYDEPFADASQLPTMLVSEESKKKVSVILSGDGGDELFGGYDRYINAKKFFKHNNHLKRFIIKSLGYLPRTLLNTIGMLLNKEKFDDKVENYIYYHIKNYSKRQNYSYHICEIKNKDKILSQNFNQNVDHLFVFDETMQNDYESFMFSDFSYYLPDKILTKVDRASMKFSQEVRIPFLDEELVNFSISLPTDYKINNYEQKILLKEILKKNIPSELISKKKIGFGVPLDQMFREELKDVSNHYFSDKELNKVNIFDTQNVIKIYQDHINLKHNEGQKLWNILILQKWFDDNKIF